jgi:hypothetical protein
MIPHVEGIRASRSPFTKGVRLVAAVLSALAILLVVSTSASAHDFGPCTIDLTPAIDENPLGAPHTFTAYVTIRGGNEDITADDQCAEGGGGPAEGKIVTFEVIDGPNVGLSGTSITGPDGKASVTYTSTKVGVDTVQASVSELSCHTQLDYDDQTLADCPPGEIFMLTVYAYAFKNWVKPNPYDPGNPYDPDHPYECTYGPYYDYGDYCADSIHGKGKKHWVGFKLGKKCRTVDFKLKPVYEGGTVEWSKLLIGKKKIKKLEDAPFYFTVPVKKIKKGKKKTLKLTTIFTDGTPIVLKTTIKRCGKS